MKLYSIGAARRWARTQDEAKRISKELGENFVVVDVPTDHAGLAVFLDGLAQNMERRGVAMYDEEHPVAVIAAQTLEDIEGPLVPVPLTPVPVAVQPALSLDTVMDWLFDTASPADIENAFSALGCRFHEMRKAARNA